MYDKKSESRIEKLIMNDNHYLTFRTLGDIYKYRYVEKLGGGCFGSVYKVKTSDNGDRALKITDPGPDEAREYNMMHNLNHTALCKYYDIYEFDSNNVIVMEFFDGMTLLDLMCQMNPKLVNKEGLYYDENCEYRVAIKTLPTIEYMNIITQLLDVVDYLHSNDIVHRDIKVENIMYNRDTKRVKLIDYGFACNISSKEC